MFKRFLSAFTAATVAITAAVVLAASPPALAAPTALELTMVPGEGLISLRDSEEPLALESPTTITGTIDNGAISGAALSTPTASFELEVLDGAATAFIDATITEIDPGTSAGAVGSDGTVSLQTQVTLDLHIDIPRAEIVTDCRSTPINLDLVSTDPYDPDTQTVTLRDPDFSIPELLVDPGCNDTVRIQANETPSGPGHSVTLALEGEIPVPGQGIYDSSTELAVTPAGGAAIGELVTMTATVASATPEATDPATGLVDFFDGPTKIGEVALVGGVATFTTTTLGLGESALVAKYRGDGVYKKSDSAVVDYPITAAPVFDVDLPSSIIRGGAPITIPVTLQNPAVGRVIDAARVVVTIKRDFQDSDDDLQPEDVVLEREGPSGVWTPVTLMAAPKEVPSRSDAVTGTIGDANGRPLAPGASLTESLRLSIPNDGTPDGRPTLPGPLRVIFEAIDPGASPDHALLSSTQGPLLLRLAERQPTRINFDLLSPPFTRAGGTLISDLTIAGTNNDPPDNSSTYHPKGVVRMRIDGVLVPSWKPESGANTPPQVENQMNEGGSILNLFMNLAPNVGIGTHTLTAEFLGDALFAPTSNSMTFEVHPPVDTPYLCLFDDLFFAQRYIVHVSAEGEVPATARPGAPIPVEGFDLSAKLGRSLSEWYSVFVLNQSDTNLHVDIDLGEHGEAGATGITQVGSPWVEDPSPVVDWELLIEEETGSITLPSTPGEVVTTAIEGFSLVADNGIIRCTPVGDPIVLGQTVVAGTTLTTELSATPTRADDLVTLRAAVSPSTATGVVEFYDGADLVGIAAIDDGVAELKTLLDEGARSLTARSRTGASAPSTTSAPVIVNVLPAADCGAYDDEGNGRAVRLVFMELLRRCPDQAGYDYWVGRLDGGLSRASFARQISDSFEARGIIVDDAYQLMLGRAADAAGRTFWANRLATNAGYDDLLADLAASDEFFTLAGGTRAGFVTRVYEQIIGRAPEPSGLEFWTDYLVARGRRSLVRALVDLPEPQAAIVVSAYDEILSRAPSTVERDDSVELFDEDKDRSALYASLIAKEEFFDRAQDLPNAED